MINNYVDRYLSDVKLWAQFTLNLLTDYFVNYAHFLRLIGGIEIETNKKFDKEYSCTWSLEQLFLKENGINYTFVKPIEGITTWKYTKTEELFTVLSQFYSKINRQNHHFITKF